jgi:hypothetical protein
VPVRLFFAKISRWGSERRILAPSRTTHRSNAVRDGASFAQEPIASARSEQEGRQLRRRKWPNLAMERGRQRQPGDDTPERGKMSVRHSAEKLPAKNRSDRAEKFVSVHMGSMYPLVEGEGDATKVCRRRLGRRKGKFEMWRTNVG